MLVRGYAELNLNVTSDYTSESFLLAELSSIFLQKIGFVQTAFSP